MKKVLFSVLFLLLAGIGVCNAKPKTELVTLREVTLRMPYEALSVSSTIRVVLEADRNPAVVRIETSGVSAEDIRAEVKSGVLYLSRNSRAKRIRDNKSGDSGCVTVYVGTGTLHKFKSTEISSIESATPIRGTAIQVDVLGSSAIRFAVESGSFDASVSGLSKYMGDVMCSGDVRVTASGSSGIHSSLTCGMLNCSIAGLSEYKGDIACAGAADVKVIGSSTLDSRLSCQTLELELGGLSTFSGDIASRDAVAADVQGSASLLSNIESQALEMGISGLSKYKGQVKCVGKSEIELSGSSSCIVKGETRELVLKTEGLSDFQGRDFTVGGLADCYVSGSSKASVHCTHELKFSVMSLSQFSYRGDPRILSQQIADSQVKSL